MEHAPTWLTYGLMYLSAAVLAVPLAKALGLGSIIGYLAAGIAIGPWGLGLVSNVQDILHFAEFGVVLMLFLVGLELQPARLWSLRRPIFGLGTAQVLGCTLLLCGAALLAVAFQVHGRGRLLEHGGQHRGEGRADRGAAAGRPDPAQQRQAGQCVRLLRRHPDRRRRLLLHLAERCLALRDRGAHVGGLPVGGRESRDRRRPA